MRTAVETTIYLHPDDRIKRRAVLHLIDASALADPGLVQVLPDRITLTRTPSGGQLVLWEFAASLAGQSDALLFNVRNCDPESQQAACEALTMWCSFPMPKQRGASL